MVQKVLAYDEFYGTKPCPLPLLMVQSTLRNSQKWKTSIRQKYNDTDTGFDGLLKVESKFPRPKSVNPKICDQAPMAPSFIEIRQHMAKILPGTGRQNDVIFDGK